MMVCSFRELKVQYGRSGVWQPEGMIVVGSGSSQSMFILYYLIKIYGFLFWSCCFPSSVPSRSSTLTQLSVLSISRFLDNGKKAPQNTLTQTLTKIKTYKITKLESNQQWLLTPILCTAHEHIFQVWHCCISQRL